MAAMDGTRINVNYGNNTIGGTSLADRNIIAGNENGYGIRLSGTGATNNVIQGNFIGVGADGTTAIGNQTGVYIDGGASDNTIGGGGMNEGNVISGNTHSRRLHRRMLTPPTT